MDYKGMPAQYKRDLSAGNEGSSSRDSSLAPSESDQQQTEGRKGNKNLDRRRESSRYAARDRRGKEADIFTDLKDVAPIVEESTVTHVDRIALLRVASTMCRMRRNAGKFLETELPAEDPAIQVFNEQSLMECLDGFVLLADSDGTILYVSESVSLFLGLTQTDLVGRFLNEFVHNNDYDELVRLATIDCDVEDASTLDDFGRYLVVRMKTVISPRGRTLNLKSALFKAILCRFRAVTTEYGRLSLIYGSSTPAGQGNCLMLANSAVKGAEATSGVYMTRHTCDMKFSYVSDSLNFLLRHDSRSLMGTSFYDLIHPSDVSAVAQTFCELFKKSHCRTPFYRLLGSNGSVVWTQTEATTVNHTARGQKGKYVLCTHSIIGMQSEAESWTEPIVDETLGAANPAIGTSRIKREVIDDMADYMGRQPEFIECVDFTPLIDPVSDVNFNDFNPTRSMNARGHISNRRQCNNANLDNNELDQAPSAKQKRKKSFEDVLSWLVREEADSPPPAFTDPNFVGNSSEDMFLDSNADSNLALFNNSQSFREEFPTQQREFQSQQQPFTGSYSTRNFCSAGQQRQATNEQQFIDSINQKQWAPNQSTINQTPAAALDGRTIISSRATGTVCGSLRTGLSLDSRPMDSKDLNVDANRKDIIENRKGASQRFSRFDEYNQRQQRGGSQTTAVTQRPQTTRTLPSIPANNGYVVSSSNQSNNGRTVNTNNGMGSKAASIMYSPVRSSNTKTAFNSSRASSANADTEDESAVQFMGKFVNGNSRSRSNSSTTSIKSYGNSAARRYSAQSSPSPQTRRPIGRRPEKSREQWPLNVNQLNAVQTQQLLQQTQYQQFQSHYNGSLTQTAPNFYYAARNTANPPTNYTNTQTSQSMDKYLQQQPIQPIQPIVDPYNGVPSKRMAYGDSEPTILDSEFQCEDFSSLAPFVPTDDIQIHDLDLEKMYPGLDFSEFFQSEVPCNPPPQMNQQQVNQQQKTNMDLYGHNQQMNTGAEQSLNEDWGFNQY